MTGRLPARLLRLEGLAILFGALALYFDAGYVTLPQFWVTGPADC